MGNCTTYEFVLLGVVTLKLGCCLWRLTISVGTMATLFLLHANCFPQCNTTTVVTINGSIIFVLKGQKNGNPVYLLLRMKFIVLNKLTLLLLLTCYYYTT